MRGQSPKSEGVLIKPESFLDYRNSDGGFPYAPGMCSFSEPTLLMILAFIAADAGFLLQPLIDWVSKNRNPDGSIGLNREFRREGLWNTSLLVIVMHRLGRAAEGEAALEFLMKYRSIGVAKTPENDLDTSLIGWPWVSETFGWVEPTAWALIALKMAGQEQHPRAIEGRRLLQDRCLEKGGWNYGNKVVFGNSLIPFWDSTSLALLALDERDGGFVIKSLNRLEESLSEIYSLYSLSLACLCLSRFGRNVAKIQEQIGLLLNSSRGEGLNLAHCALGLLALSPQKVLTP
jgi:hypothetical protein